MEDKYTFSDFWYSLNFKPREFFTQFTGFNHSPFLFLVIITYGISSAVARLDSQLVKYEAQGKLDLLSTINRWDYYWIIAIISGILSGYLAYYLGGWFYNLRIKWSKGESDIKKARFIFLYSSFVPSFLAVMVTVTEFTSQSKPYMPDKDIAIIDIVLIAIVLISNYYSVYVSYVGVTSASNVDRSRARIWFLILPVLFYSLALIGFIALIFYLMKQNMLV